MKKSKSIAEHFKEMDKINEKFGIKRGPGRPELPQEEKMQCKNIRFTPAQIVKLSILGGAKWIRAKIDKEKVK